METTNKIIYNTIILYIKIIVCMFISLWSVPLLLKALGAKDYGLYNLIGGVIAMLSFLNGAMTVASQRFMSVTMGTGNKKQLNEVYNTSILLHFVIGIIVVLLFEFCGLFVFDTVLNIDNNRIEAAKWIYQFLVISMFFTIMSVPFDAILNAYENMMTFSIISIVESIFKLALAITLTLTFNSNDKLISYGAGIAAITILTSMAKFLYVKYKYPNLSIQLRDNFNKETFKEMFSFAGWNSFSSVAMVGRNQGIAIILNLFFGTIINAAYGIANQINGLLNYFSVTIQKSINPQLMQSEGMGNRERMLKMAFLSSKYSVLILGTIAIPLIIEMPFVLELWLKDVPPHTLSFCRLILILSIISQYSAGIMAAIQSNGKIKLYTTTITLVLLLNLPLSYLLLAYNFDASSVIITLILIEIIALATRLCFAKKLLGFKVISFLTNIVIPTSFLFFLNYALFLFLTTYFDPSLYRVILVGILSVISTASLSFLFFCSEQEQKKIKTIINKFIKS